jgi:hypothetical protein
MNNMYQNPTKYMSFFFRKLTFFHGFLGAYYDSVQSFFSARQVSEIILNESFKSTKNAQIETTKIYKKHFPKSKEVSLSVVSRTGFGIFLTHLGGLKK